MLGRRHRKDRVAIGKMRHVGRGAQGGKLRPGQENRVALAPAQRRGDLGLAGPDFHVPPRREGAYGERSSPRAGACDANPLENGTGMSYIG
jgi:hypothetical protein